MFDKTSPGRLGGLLTLTLALALALTGCGKSQKTADDNVPGQVIAKVAGQEVTIHEFDTERAALGPAAARDDEATRRQIMTALVDRKLLVKKALDAGLDRQPSIMLDIRRARELVLSQAIIGRDLSKLPSVNREDAEKFVLDHPTAFSQRQVFALDEVVIAASDATPELMEATKSAKSLADIEKALTDRHIAFRHPIGTLNSADLPAERVPDFAHTRPDDILFFRVQNSGMFAKVLSAHPDPVEGEQALAVATRILRQKATEEAMTKEREAIEKSGDVQYIGDFAKLMASAPKTDDAKPADATTPAPADAKSPSPAATP